MANTSGIGVKFAIAKVADIEHHLSQEKQGQLAGLFSEIEEGRSCQGKKSNLYLVINTDEPYADEVIEIMKRHGHWGQPSPCNPPCSHLKTSTYNHGYHKVYLDCEEEL